MQIVSAIRADQSGLGIAQSIALRSIKDLQSEVDIALAEWAKPDGFSRWRDLHPGGIGGHMGCGHAEARL